MAREWCSRKKIYFNIPEDATEVRRTTTCPSCNKKLSVFIRGDMCYIRKHKAKDLELMYAAEAFVKEKYLNEKR